MAFFITKPEDFTDNSARAMFMACAKAFHGGDIQAAVIEYNQKMLKLEEIENRQFIKQQAAANEIRLRFTKR